MTVALETWRVERAWTGVEATFNSGIETVDKAFIKAQAVAADDSVTALVQGVNYSVTLDPVTAIATLTPISLPAAPQTIVIWRDTPGLQPVNYADVGTVPKTVLGYGLDRLTQKAVETAGRVAEFEYTVSASVAADRARGEIAADEAEASALAAAAAGKMLSFETRAALELATVPVGTNIVHVQGRLAAGDGGDAFYVRGGWISRTSNGWGIKATPATDKNAFGIFTVAGYDAPASLEYGFLGNFRTATLDKLRSSVRAADVIDIPATGLYIVDGLDYDRLHYCDATAGNSVEVDLGQIPYNRPYHFMVRGGTDDGKMVLALDAGGTFIDHGTGTRFIRVSAGTRVTVWRRSKSSYLYDASYRPQVHGTPASNPYGYQNPDGTWKFRYQDGTATPEVGIVYNLPTGFDATNAAFWFSYVEPTGGDMQSAQLVSKTATQLTYSINATSTFGSSTTAMIFGDTLTRADRPVPPVPMIDADYTRVTRACSFISAGQSIDDQGYDAGCAMGKFVRRLAELGGPASAWLIDASFGGSYATERGGGLASGNYWVDTSAYPVLAAGPNLTAMLAAIASRDGDATQPAPAWIKLNLGYTDTETVFSEGDSFLPIFKAALTYIITQARAAVGSTIPAFIQQMGRRVSYVRGEAEGWPSEKIRQAQREVQAALGTCYLSNDMIDVPMQDTSHPDDFGNWLLGGRDAEDVAHHVYAVAYGASPLLVSPIVLASASRNADNSIDFKFETGIENRNYFTENPCGISLISAAGASIPIARMHWQNSQQLPDPGPATFYRATLRVFPSIECPVGAKAAVWWDNPVADTWDAQRCIRSNYGPMGNCVRPGNVVIA